MLSAPEAPSESRKRKKPWACLRAQRRHLPASAAAPQSRTRGRTRQQCGVAGMRRQTPEPPATAAAVSKYCHHRCGSSESVSSAVTTTRSSSSRPMRDAPAC